MTMISFKLSFRILSYSNNSVWQALFFFPKEGHEAQRSCRNQLKVMQLCQHRVHLAHASCSSVHTSTIPERDHFQSSPEVKSGVEKGCLGDKV